MRIAFEVMGSDKWRFGVVHLADLVSILRETIGCSFGACLLTPSNSNFPQELRGLIDEVVIFKDRRVSQRLLNQLGNLLSRDDSSIDKSLRKYGIQMVAFVQGPLDTKIPTLGWLPDFQHARLPEMFSQAERRERENLFAKLAAQSTRVAILSRSVLDDFQFFLPSYSLKARVISPVSRVPTSIYSTDPRSVCVSYQIPDRFIYYPSQFWKHKNHSLAFSALRILKDRGSNVFLVCSGYPGDYRNPKHYANLIQQLSELDIKQQVALLGLIPHEDVFKLIRQSVCVLTPSLFEGFGMPVEEARSVGKTVLASDIPPHREQNPPGGVYFDPADSDALAEMLERIWRERKSGPEPILEEEARQSLPWRTRNYAESFLSVAQECVRETSAVTG